MNYVAKLGRIVTPHRSSKTPPDYLAQFTATWSLIETSLRHPHLNVPELEARLDTLAALLGAEHAQSTRLGQTGECEEHLFRHDVVHTLVAHSLVSNVSVQNAVVKWLATLIDALNDHFLAHSAIHRPLTRLLRSYMPSGSEAFIPDASLELQLVQLLCHVCSRVKHLPDLLGIFFRPAASPPADPRERVASPTPTHSSVASTSTQSQARPAECLLFSCLLCFVHREGPIGDLARTSLLLLIEVAFTSHNNPPDQTPAVDGPKMQEISLLFAEWLLDSDLTEVVAAGLGALYSILPGKLYTHLRTLSGLPDVCPIQTSSPPSPHLDAMGLKEAEVQAALSVYLSLFTFAENVLLISYSCSKSNREKALVSGMLTDTMLTTINTLFTENVLYLSLVESSTTDGSAFAALVYLDRLLQTLAPQGILPRCILDNLLLEHVAADQSYGSTRQKKVKRRKSNAVMLLEATKPSPSKADDLALASTRAFSLRDMLMQGMRCPLESEIGQLTRQTSFSVLSTLLFRHHATSAILFDEVQVHRQPHFRTLQGLAPDANDEEEDMFIYPGSIAQTPSVAESLFERVRLVEQLKALAESIQAPRSKVSQSACSYDRYLSTALDLLAHNTEARSVSSNQTSSVSIRRSPLLRLLLSSLSAFFLQHPQTNLKLTACITCLATNPFCLIEDWFSDNQQGDPSVAQILGQLVEQLKGIRGQVDQFDQLLVERRQSLMMADDLADALAEESFGNHRPPSSPANAMLKSVSVASKDENPFSDHYAQTGSMKVTLPPLTPAFADQPKVLLSAVLDSAIVLEEFIKEVASILQMRLACGIDAVA